MKLKLLITTSLLTALLSAQAHAGIMPEVGVKLGLDFSKNTGTATPNSSFGFGYGIGPMAVVNFGPFLAFATELTLNKKSYSSVTQSTKVWDITIPVMARFTLMPMIFVQGGASLSYGMGSTSVTPTGGVSTSTPYYNATTSPNGIGRSDMGLVLGVGTTLPMPQGSLQVEGRMTYGISDRTVTPANTQKTLNLELSAGYLF